MSTIKKFNLEAYCKDNYKFPTEEIEQYWLVGVSDTGRLEIVANTKYKDQAEQILDLIRRGTLPIKEVLKYENYFIYNSYQDIITFGKDKYEQTNFYEVFFNRIGMTRYLAEGKDYIAVLCFDNPSEWVYDNYPFAKVNCHKSFYTFRIPKDKIIPWQNCNAR